MNLSALFIKRPVTTTLIQLSIVIFGIIGYRALAVSDLPAIDFPTIQVTAVLPGANPETMASAVATPLEKQFSAIAGVSSISSTSYTGSTSITLQFDLDRDIDAAAQDVQLAISRTRGLPPDMREPPSFQKVNPADFPVLFLTLSSETLPLSAINEYAETNIAQRISTIKGVAQVNIFGAQKHAVQVEVDPRQLAARDLDLEQIATAINRNSVNRPTGTLYGPDRTLALKTDGQLMTAEAFRPLVVSYRDGRPVRLDEVARVYDGVENDRQASWYNGARNISIAINRQPGANTVETVDAIKAILPQIQAQLPAALNLQIRLDRSLSIRESIHDIQLTLIFTVVLVVLVIFLFLRNLSATLIPSLALPASIIGTFAAMHVLGFSLNNLSLMALTLAVAFVVDDAIVMLENIVRHMEHGEDPLTAAFKGSKEIGFTIVSITLSLVAVFIPILFMGGVVGRLLYEFAVTMGISILISGFVALSLTPMLAAKFLKPHAEQKHGRMYMATERMFDASRDAYGWLLHKTMVYRGTTMIASLLLVVATVYCFRIIPMGFIPSQDISQINAQTEMAQGLGFDAVVAHQIAIADIIQADPNVQSVTSSIGGGFGGSAGNTGRLQIELKPRSERTLTADEVIESLRPKLTEVPGVRAFLTNPPVINIGGRPTRAPYQFTLTGGDTEALYEGAVRLEQQMRELPGLQDVTSDLMLTNPQVNVSLDRARMAAIGLNADQVEGAMFNAFGSRQVSQIYAPNNAYQVILRVAPEYQRDASALELLHVRTPGGQRVPLSSLTSVESGVGPLAVNHTGQLASVTISFNTRPGVSLGDAVAQVQQSALSLPASVSTSFQGAAQAFQESTRGLGIILLMAIFVIYIVLGILYESFIHPLTILSGLPAAGLGALVTLLVFGVDLNIYAFVGVIMLVGLVKKNGIMMIDFAIEAQRNEGKSPADAMYEACIVRFRPIMMTTMAALVGTLPIALGWGAGAESRQPLGLAVVGGLLVSQTLTLFITPVFYLYMESLSAWLRGERPAMSVRFDRAAVPATNGRSAVK